MDGDSLSCPNCGPVVRKSDGFGGTNLAAVIAGDLAVIDSWLDAYSTETSFTTTKRDAKTDGKVRWAVDTSHDIAVECLYDEQNPRFVAIRALTKVNAESVFLQRNSLTLIAARSGVQPCGERHSSSNIFDGNSTDGYWGMVQYLSVHALTTQLLAQIINRLASAMTDAIAELGGGSEE